MKDFGTLSQLSAMASEKRVAVTVLPSSLISRRCSSSLCLNGTAEVWPRGMTIVSELDPSMIANTNRLASWQIRECYYDEDL